MSDDIDAHRDALGELADALLAHREAIVERWLALVAQDARAADVPMSDLRDGIDDYLIGLAAALRSGDTLEGGTKAWAKTAEEHALTRVRIGFDVSQLVHEFILLRGVIFQAVQSELRAPWQSARIADLIEAAIAEAVKSYADARDYEQRKREAEHIGFITHELRNPLNVAVLATAKLRVPRERANAHDLLVRSHQRLNTTASLPRSCSRSFSRSSAATRTSRGAASASRSRAGPSRRTAGRCRRSPRTVAAVTSGCRCRAKRVPPRTERAPTCRGRSRPPMRGSAVRGRTPISPSGDGCRAAHVQGAPP